MKVVVDRSDHAFFYNLQTRIVETCAKVHLHFFELYSSSQSTDDAMLSTDPSWIGGFRECP